MEDYLRVFNRYFKKTKDLSKTIPTKLVHERICSDLTIYNISNGTMKKLIDHLELKKKVITYGNQGDEYVKEIENSTKFRWMSDNFRRDFIHEHRGNAKIQVNSFVGLEEMPSITEVDPEEFQKLKLNTIKDILNTPNISEYRRVLEFYCDRSQPETTNLYDQLSLKIGTSADNDEEDEKLVPIIDPRVASNPVGRDGMTIRMPSRMNRSTTIQFTKQ